MPTLPWHSPTLILPATWTLGTETETINDLVAHNSREVSDVNSAKQVHIRAVEVVAAGTPGNLRVWVETSPYSNSQFTTYWSAIGGGGGPVDPLSPSILVPTSVNGAAQTLVLPWTMHTAWVRVVVRMPVAATPLTDHWTVQVFFSGFE